MVYGAEPRAAAAAYRTVRRIALTMKNYLVQNVSGATVETAWARLRYSQMILKCMSFFFFFASSRVGEHYLELGQPIIKVFSF